MNFKEGIFIYRDQGRFYIVAEDGRIYETNSLPQNTIFGLKNIGLDNCSLWLYN